MKLAGCICIAGNGSADCCNLFSFHTTELRSKPVAEKDCPRLSLRIKKVPEIEGERCRIGNESVWVFQWCEKSLLGAELMRATGLGTSGQDGKRNEDDQNQGS